MEKLERAIRDTSQKATVQVRRVRLWNLVTEKGWTFSRCSKELGVSMRQLFADWAVIRPLMIGALADEIETTRTRCTARANYIYRKALEGIAAIMGDPEALRKAPSALSNLMHTALKANWDCAQLLPGVVSYRHELTGKGGGPIEVLNLDELSDEELDREIEKAQATVDRLVECSHIPPPGFGGNGDDPDVDEDEDEEVDAGGNGKG